MAGKMVARKVAGMAAQWVERLVEKLVGWSAAMKVAN
jgi:hypothetical protein